MSFSVLLGVDFKTQMINRTRGLLLNPVPTQLPIDSVLESSVVVVVFKEQLLAVVT